MRQLPSKRLRVVCGPLLLVAGVVLLGAGFVLMQIANGLSERGLTPEGWLIATLSGIAFVHCQTTAAYWMASLAKHGVTSPRPPSSTKKDSEAQP